MSSEARVRVGIDVGGTFTHAVAVTARATEVLAAVRVPTSHGAAEGVAAGILESLRRLLAEAALAPGQVDRVAHSTTQATNALLEGDVSPIGVLCVGEGWEGSRAAGESQLGELEMAPGRSLVHHHRYVELRQGELDEDGCRAAIDELVAAGAGALVMASAFSVDDPRHERRLLALAEARQVPATATHEISQLYGLSMRTRTAAVNAAILPRMLETAVHTEQAVRRLGIEAPLVVMRSDGGAMDIAAMKRRPILTMLSGPAAGVAAALMWARIADGLFLEVGGTSTDVSCIQNGRPHVRPARIGSHRLYLDTLDVRTLGVAGGSMARLDPAGRVTQVGPRSAHIAGLGYAVFTPEAPGEELLRVAPRPGDPADYLALGAAGEPRRTLTPTCAAHLTGDVHEGDAAAAAVAFGRAGAALGRAPEELARELLEVGARPTIECVQDLIRDYRLDPRRVRLVGGGGGGAVWVPQVARAMQLPHEIAPHAAVISAIGAALALLQEVVERTLVEPRPEDFRAIRREAEQRVLAGGAAPETVEVRVEVDAQRGILRAVAIGSHDLQVEDDELDDEALVRRAQELFEPGSDQPHILARTEGLRVLGSERVEARFFGLWRTTRTPWRVLDRRGRVRLGSSHGEVVPSSGAAMLEDVERTFGRLARYGDAGRQLPPAFLLARSRTVDLSGLPTLAQRLEVLGMEAERIDPGEPVALAVDLEGHP